MSVFQLETEKSWADARIRDEKLGQVNKLLDSTEFNQCIIFAHTHICALRASTFLNGRGWANTLLSGRLDQEVRTQAWEQLVTKETSVLVATDVGKH